MTDPEHGICLTASQSGVEIVGKLNTFQAIYYFRP